jgi:uncharacterized protein (DUF2267 family)
MTAVTSIERSSQRTNVWLNETVAQLDWTDSQRAFTALRAVLHALRDRLPIAEIVQLGAQLPTFLRGVYYEGWKPTHTPLKDRRTETFLNQIQHAFHPAAPVDANHVARAVIRVLLKHVSDGEMEQVRAAIPHEIREFWPSVVPFLKKTG